MDKKSMYLLGFFFSNFIRISYQPRQGPPPFFLALETLCTSARTTLDGWWGHVTCMHAYLYTEGGLKA